MTGPAAIETPPAAVHQPIAFASIFLSWAYAKLRMDRELGTSRAAPMPWKARAASSATAVGASAHVTDAAANKPKPARKTPRAPYLSPITPAASRNTAKPSV